MKKFLALSGFVFALALTGCSQVGAAATIGGTKITQATVQSSIDSILGARAGVDTSQMQLETGAALNLSQLRFHLLTVLFRKTGEELKLSVSKAEIDTRRAEILEQIGGEAGLPEALVSAGIAADDLDAYLEAMLISDKISQAITSGGVPQEQVGLELQKLIVAKAKELGVTINPRYGKWDPASADVIPVDSASPAVTPATK